jgi:hypothetical protein
MVLEVRAPQLPMFAEHDNLEMLADEPAAWFVHSRGRYDRERTSGTRKDLP